MFQREMTFKQRQKQDLDALMKRIQSGREEQKKQRQVDLERYTEAMLRCLHACMIDVCV